MDNPLQNTFKIQIQSLYKIDFQNFITKLFMFRHGAENYIPPRDIKDKGADGIIISKETVVACYGPEKIDKQRYTDKIEGDFKSYKDNWIKRYKNWMFVTNNDIPEWAIRKINLLKKDAIQVGLKNIIQIIEELSSYQKRELGNYLNIDKTLFAQDYLKNIIEDLLKDSTFTDENVKYKQRIDFPEKLELNFKKHDIDDVLFEYDSYIENGVFNDILGLLSAYDDEDFEKLKHRIKYDYSNKSGNFKNRLQQITEQYLNKYASENDDEYLYYIRGILIYLFEQCLIGKKTKEEL